MSTFPNYESLGDFDRTHDSIDLNAIAEVPAEHIGSLAVVRYRARPLSGLVFVDRGIHDRSIAAFFELVTDLTKTDNSARQFLLCKILSAIDDEIELGVSVELCVRFVLRPEALVVGEPFGWFRGHADAP